MICQACHNQIPGDGRFCPRCGAVLVSGSTAPEAKRAGDMIGHIFDGKYRIGAKIGEGGMGMVYKATRLAIGDSVAVKVLHADLVAKEGAVKRFRREAQAAARLKHPNAVSIHDFGVSGDGLVYLVMEVVEGQSLRSIIKEQGPLLPPVAADLISQVCAALDEAHHQNIVHRDLKPDNIIVAKPNGVLRVKVLDFGIAKLSDLSAGTDHLTETGMVVGTPHYMSPEQCLGEEIDGRSDIYSLGIVLYEILTGALPFNSATPTSIIVQHVTQIPLSLCAINMNISPAVESVVLRTLEKRRDARPQSAMALAREFSAAVNSGRFAQPLTYAQTVMNAPRPTSTQRASAATGLAPMGVSATPTGGSEVAMPITPMSLPGYVAPAAKSHNRFMALLVAASLIALIAVVAWFLLAHEAAHHDEHNHGAEDDKRQSNGKAGAGNLPARNMPQAPMVHVAGEEFLMGSDTGGEYEHPQHTATVKPFFIDRHEVTCQEYAAFIQDTGHPAPAGWVHKRPPENAKEYPVTGITWDDANAYSTWAGKRLPTEEEWEFAARGTDGRRYPWGNEWKRNVANLGAATGDQARPAVVEEHSDGASPFGAYDMAGNVWEWTASDLTAYPGGQSPPGTRDGHKVVRGGSFKSGKSEATTTFRKGYPARGAGDYSQIGFRCAKDGEASESSR